MDKILAMDKIFDKIAALGVPALVLVVAMAMTGLYGAAAITAALAMIGPFGIIGGIHLRNRHAWDSGSHFQSFGRIRIRGCVQRSIEQNQGIRQNERGNKGNHCGLLVHLQSSEEEAQRDLYTILHKRLNVDFLFDNGYHEQSSISRCEYGLLYPPVCFQTSHQQGIKF